MQSLKKYSLSRSPKPFSYLSHVWSISTEPSTLRWMTVEPPSREWIGNIFQIYIFQLSSCCTSHTKVTQGSGSLLIIDNVNGISTPLSDLSDNLFLWLSSLITFFLFVPCLLPLVSVSEYRKSILMLSLRPQIAVVSLTWTHFTVNVEWLRLVWLDNIYSTVCLSFVKQLTAVHGEVWNTMKKMNASKFPQTFAFSFYFKMWITDNTFKIILPFESRPVEFPVRYSNISGAAESESVGLSTVSWKLS